MKLFFIFILFDSLSLLLVPQSNSGSNCHLYNLSLDDLFHHFTYTEFPNSVTKLGLRVLSVSESK